jgi:hypothetical protein
MEKYAELVASAQFACTILGNISTWDVLLLRCPYQPHDLRDQVSRRGLRVLGVAALVDGTARTALAPELAGAPSELIAILSLAFAAEVESWLAGDMPTLATETTETPEQPDDSIGWCERLFALPDTRG